MSEDGTMASKLGDIGNRPAAEPKLYGANGDALRGGAQAAAGQVDQLATFVREQPLSAALAALIIGYLLGKIT